MEPPISLAVDLNLISVQIMSRGVKAIFNDRLDKFFSYIPGCYKTSKKRKDFKYKFIHILSAEELETLLYSLPLKKVNTYLDFSPFPYEVVWDRVPGKIKKTQTHERPPKNVRKFPRQELVEMVSITTD